MINFPIFESLKIENYGLFPGQADNTLNVSFKPGTTLVLGTNGLGKTTLITILYRMLTGPYELRKTSLGSSLGGASLEPRKLVPRELETFSNRVYDGAHTASATFEFSIGTRRITIQRSLKNLFLQSFTIDGEAHDCNENIFQENMTAAAGVWSFGDWLLMLHNLVFYFEDRRALVWDPSAQREILRFLFLTSEQAENWYKSEREILTLDSQARNDHAALNRIRKSVATEEMKLKGTEALKAELESLDALQEEEENNLADMVDISSSLDAQRHEIRHELLLAEQERESISRELERAKLISIKNHFPQKKEIGQYLLAQLIVDGKCLACNNTEAETISEYSSRLDNGLCVICGFNTKSQNEVIDSIEFSAERVEKLYNSLHQTEDRVSSLESDLNKSSTEYNKNAQTIAELRIKCDKRNQRIEDLIKSLPQDDVVLRKKRQHLSTLQDTVDESKARVKTMGEAFEAFVKSVVTGIQEKSESVKESFHAFAHGFLLEQCILKWSPQIGKVGELGVRIEFPAFDLDMSGVDFPSPSRRRGPEQVSESQREFIDLAFRMALIIVAGEGRGGSLVIDAPESSLDGVFVERAAEVLTRFGASESKNRLIIASNVVQGELIPSILKKGCPPAEASERLINLMILATPTAALREKRLEYQALFNVLLEKGGLLNES